MATCRCAKHPPLNNRKHIYLYTKNPIGYPNAATICGNINCHNVGLIWLTQDEENAYQNNNRRLFDMAGTHIIKVQVH
jgi:hypothetical protein